MPEYLSEGSISQQLITQARCGNLKNQDRYWEKEEGRLCDLCGGTTFNKVGRCSELKTLEVSLKGSRNCKKKVEKVTEYKQAKESFREQERVQ